MDKNQNNFGTMNESWILPLVDEEKEDLNSTKKLKQWMSALVGEGDGDLNRTKKLKQWMGAWTSWTYARQFENEVQSVKKI